MTGKNRIIILIALFLVPVLQLPADSLSLSVSAGFSGWYEAESWLPLAVTIESELPPFEARLEASVPRGGFHLSKRNTYTLIRELTLTPDAVSRILMTLPLEGHEELSLRLYRGEELLTGKVVNLSPRAGSGENILLLSRAALPGLEPSDRRAVVQTHPGLLPVSAEGYGSVSAVVLDDAPLNEMSPAQVGAMLNWLRGGGQIIVTGGVQARDRIPAELRDVFPVDSFGLTAADAVFIDQTAAVRNEGLGRIVSVMTGTDLFPEDFLTEPRSVSSVGAEYPVIDPMPSLITRTGDLMPGSGMQPPLTAAFILIPPAVLVLILLFKRRPSGIIPMMIILPLLSAGSIFLPDDKAVYREISVIRGLLPEKFCRVEMKCGITGRSGGRLFIPLPDGVTVLPDGNDDAVLLKNAGGRALLLERTGWGTSEFFIAPHKQRRVDIDLKSDGDAVTGFVEIAGTVSGPVFLGGKSTPEKIVTLFEPSGFSFRLVPGAGTSDLPAQHLHPAGRAVLDYLNEQDLIAGDTEADFYIVYTEEDGETLLIPDGHQCLGLRIFIIGVVL